MQNTLKTNNCFYLYKSLPIWKAFFMLQIHGFSLPQLEKQNTTAVIMREIHEFVAKKNVFSCFEPKGF